MTVELPVAGVEVNWLALAALGSGVGFLAGLLGVGGGFVLTPLLMSLGVPPESAVGSSIAQFTGVAASGAYHHWRAGNVDTRFGALLAGGGIAGFSAGAFFKRGLCAAGSFGFWVRVIYVVVLAGIGLYMLVESSRAGGGGLPARRGLLARLPWTVEFPASGVRMNPGVPAALGALVGICACLMGIGGGVIFVPLLIYVAGLPTRAAVGTSLFQIAGVSLVGTVIEAKVNAAYRPVDVALVFILLAGSTVGVRVGAWLSVRTGARRLRRVFSLVVLAVLGKVAHELAAGKAGAAARPAGGGNLAAFAADRPVLYGLAVAVGAGVFGLATGILLRTKKSAR